MKRKLNGISLILFAILFYMVSNNMTVILT